MLTSSANDDKGKYEGFPCTFSTDQEDGDDNELPTLNLAIQKSISSIQNEPNEAKVAKKNRRKKDEMKKLIQESERLIRGTFR
jgi:hypothetical protein